MSNRAKDFPTALDVGRHIPARAAEADGSNAPDANLCVSAERDRPESANRTCGLPVARRQCDDDAMPVLLLAPLLAAAASPAPATERTVMLTGFDRVRVEGPFEVEVRTGAGSGARVIADDGRAADAVNVRVQGTTLVVSARIDGWGGYPGERTAPARVVVTTPGIRGASVVGSGRLAVDRMRGQSVDVAVTGPGTIAVRAIDADLLNAVRVGTGQLAVQGRSARARFVGSGPGSIDARELAVDDLTATLEGPGDAGFTANRSATINASGTGTVDVAGVERCTVRGTAPVRCGIAAR